ncbi:MAG: metal-dependent hydrolase [Methanospirillum sp.]
MLVFCHLFVGAAIGLAFARATGDRRFVTAGLVAGILPDLIDKPLGHILFASTLDNGRLIAHSLVFVLVLFVAVTVLLRDRRTLFAPAIAIAVLSHQFLDAMWRDPSAWYFPLLGPFMPGHYPDYFRSGLVAELGSPSEWLFGFAALALILAVLRPAFVPGGITRLAERLLPVLAVVVGVAGLGILASGVLGLPTLFAPGLRPPDEILLGLGAMVSAVIVGYEYSRMGRESLEQFR